MGRQSLRVHCDQKRRPVVLEKTPFKGLPHLIYTTTSPIHPASWPAPSEAKVRNTANARHTHANPPPLIRIDGFLSFDQHVLVQRLVREMIALQIPLRFARRGGSSSGCWIEGLGG